MKNKKIIKYIKVISVILFLIIIGVSISMLTNNTAMATSYDYVDSNQHMAWNSTGYPWYEPHFSYSWSYEGNGTHWSLCAGCGGGVTRACSGGTHSNGGKCTSCGGQYDPHSQSSTVSSYATTATTHTPQYKCSNSSCSSTYTGTTTAHTGGTSSNGGTCTACGYQYEAHYASSTIISYNTTSTTHTPVYSCTVSGCTETFTGTEVAHSGATHNNDGICTTCNYEYQPHGRADNIIRYETSSTGHKAVYSCTGPGCGTTYIAAEFDHTGGTHSNGGKCTTCQYQYQTHSQSSTVSSYSTTASTHTPNYACTYSGCTSTYAGTAVSHSGGTHTSGTCSTCSYKYQTHSKTSTISSYSKSPTTHTPKYKCSVSGCSSTFNGTAVSHSGASHSNGGKCSTCSYVYQTHSKSSTIKSYTQTDTGHIPVYACSYSSCASTYNGSEASHTGGTHDNGGACTECTQQYQTHSQSEEIKEYKPSENGHIAVYKCTVADCETTYNGTEELPHEGAEHSNDGKCTACGEQYEIHSQSEEIKEYKTTETGHTPVYECTIANCETTYEGQEVAHEGAEHTNDGKCTVCTYQYEIHSQSENIKEYKPGENGHIAVYKCTISNCETTYDGTEELPHEGAEHTNDGKCTKCNEQYETHSQSEEIKEYKPSENGHIAVYKCTVANCETTYDGTKELPHEGAEHSNDGKCTACGEQYEIHSQSEEIKEYKTTETGHTPVYKCTIANCETTYDGQEVAHEGADHSNDGKCTVCTYQYETHSQSEEIKEYKQGEDGHIAVYKCTVADCETTYDGTEELPHEGAEHANDGKCTKCNEQYEIHSQSEEIKEYKKAETGHTPVYKCTESTCATTYDGKEEKHTGGTHENDGICKVEGCGYKYQIHTQSEEIKEYKTAQTGHTPVYKCTETTCATTYDGEEEAHTGGTHENDGTCTIDKCGYKYQTHSQSEEIKEYKTAQTGHTPVYKCTEQTCETTYDGEEAVHTGANHENDGTCTVEGCGYKYQTHEKSEQIKEYKTSETGHTPLYKCTEPTCETTFDGEEEAHTGGTHENDGTCTVDECGYKYQTHTKSEEIKEYKIAETGHTPVYKCTESSCDTTYDGEEVAHTGGTHENDGTCTVEGCGYKYQTHEQSEQIKEYKTSETGHTPLYKCTEPTCETTFDGEEEAHTGGTHENDGTCTVDGCGYKYHIHSQSEEIKEYKTAETGHTPVYKCTESSCDITYDGEETEHTGGMHENDGTCTVEGCGYQYQTHSQSEEIKEYKPVENGHIAVYKCTTANCETTYDGTEELPHEGAEHSNDGKCTVCEEQYETHEQSEEIKEYKPGENGHIAVYKCTTASCETTYDGDEELPHEGAEHTNDGKCTKCNKQYEIHNQSEEIKEYKPGENGHIAVYKCTTANCAVTYDATEELPHEGAEHANDGKCTVCEEQYETHEQSEEIKEYKPGENGHIAVYKCTTASCETTYDGDEELPHEGAEHTNDGKCTKCNKQYQIHSQSEEIKEYKPGENGHIAVYKCTIANCETTYDGEEELPHEGAEHSNEGKCTICGEQYETHNQSEEIKEYKPGENGHIAVYKCTTANCETTYDATKELPHEGAEHANDGKCTACGEQYETHEQSEEIKEYKPGENGHIAVYKCSVGNCETTYDGNEELPHEGANHENEGKCTAQGCGYKYQTHGKSEEIKEYKITELGHTPIYRCSDSTCTEIYEGEEEEHKGGNHENDGTCIVEGCVYKYQSHEKSEEIKEYKTAETGHTPIYKCTEGSCSEAYSGEEQLHEGASHENEGKCTTEGCGYKYQTHGKSEEIKEYKTTETGHAPVYKCTDPTCTEIYEGEEEEHTVENREDIGGGKHSGNCEICKKEVTENHNYKDGECEDCKAEQPEEKCEHTYVKKSDKNYHWEECSKCGEEKTGSRELHKFEKYTDNKDGTHSSSCTDCKHVLTEKHNYENEECKDCKAEQLEEKCEHTYVKKSDKEYHWEECSKCGEEKPGSKELHNYEKYTDNKDGTHSSTCTDCKHVLTEKHNYKDEKCTNCKAVEPIKIDTSTSTNGNKEDNTTSNQEIPKAGFQTIVAMMAAFAVVALAISVYKMNKYKDI